MSTSKVLQLVPVVPAEPCWVKDESGREHRGFLMQKQMTDDGWWSTCSWVDGRERRTAVVPADCCCPR